MENEIWINPDTGERLSVAEVDDAALGYDEAVAWLERHGFEYLGTWL